MYFKPAVYLKFLFYSLCPILGSYNLTAQTVTYTESTEDFTNPDRGLYLVVLKMDNQLFINMKPFFGKQAHILLMNQYGQLVKDVTLDEINEAPVRIEVGDVPNGMYLLTI
ncbi:MAG: hypothetical protein AB8G86_03390 [Saprospiraceae bacterium]